MSDGCDVLSMLDEVRAIAQTGLSHSDDPYHTRRYEQLLSIVSEYYGEALDMPPESVRARLREELGYVTPKVGAASVVFDAQNRVLLMRRADTDQWCLPSGMTDHGESVEQTAIRETREETGLTVEIERLIDLYALSPGENGPHHFIGVAYLCSVVSGELRLSHEGTELRYRTPDRVSKWFSDHETVVRDAMQLWV